MTTPRKQERLSRARISSFVVVIVLFGVGFTRGAGIQWVGLGPAGTVVDKIAIDPQDSSNVFLHVERSGSYQAGIVKSSDGGRTWIAVNVPAFAVSFGPPNVVLAGGAGIFRSVDGGDSWTQTYPNSLGIFTLATDPENPKIVFAGTNCGDPSHPSCVLKSIDAGLSWSFSGPNIQVGGRTVFVLSIAIDPADHLVVYAVGTVGFFKSTDGGESWFNPALPPNNTPTFGGTDVAIDPSESSHVYLAGGGGAAAGGFAESFDGGANWVFTQHVSINGFSSFAFDPSDAGSVYLGGDGVFYRPRAGPPEGPEFFSLGPAKVYVSCLVVDFRSHFLYAGTEENGVFRSLDLSGCNPSVSRCISISPAPAPVPAPIVGRPSSP